MLDQVAPMPPGELTARVAAYPYDRHVFCFPPWEAIYACDAERDQTFADAVRVHAVVVEWYVRCGYDIVEVPRGSVGERCAFVLDALTRGSA